MKGNNGNIRLHIIQNVNTYRRAKCQTMNSDNQMHYANKTYLEISILGSGGGGGNKKKHRKTSFYYK